MRSNPYPTAAPTRAMPGAVAGPVRVPASPAAAVHPVAAAPPTWTAFRLLLAAFILVAVARTADVLSFMGKLYPGKVVVVLLAAVVVVGGLPRERIRAALTTPAARAMFVVSIFAVLSIPFALWPGGSFEFLTTKYIQTMVLFAVVAAGFTDRRTARLCLTALVLAVGLDAVRVFAGGPMNSEGRAMISTTLDPNDSGALFVTTIPFALMLASRGGLRRWLYYFIALLCVGALVRTGSRGGFVALLVLGAWLFFLAKGRQRLVYVGLMIGAAGMFSLLADDFLRARFKSTFNPESDYNSTDREGRLEIWKRGVGYMAAYPLTGVGLENFPVAEGTISGKRDLGYGVRYTAAHNSFIEVGAETGVFGLGAFIVALASAVFATARARRRARGVHPPTAQSRDEVDLTTAALSGLVAVITSACFLSLAYHPILLFFLAVSIGLAVGSPYLSAPALASVPQRRAH